MDHRDAVSDTVLKQRKWAGFICPVCRFVFRVPKDYDGKGVVCPACRQLLNLPENSLYHMGRENLPDLYEGSERPPSRAAKEKREPIVSRALTINDRARSDISHEKGNKVKRRRSRSAHGMEWEKSRRVIRRDASSGLLWILGVCLSGMTVAGIGAWLLFQGMRVDDVRDVTVSSEELPVARGGDVRGDSKEFEKSFKTRLSVLKDVEVVVEKFLNAASIEEAALHVRSPEVTVPRMHQWYKDEPWRVLGVQDIAVNDRLSIKGDIVFLLVRLNDYSLRGIALEKDGSVYKVDWESWVAWSSMPWKELFEKKPEEPIEVRVTCSRDYYYNRFFSDETKWQVFKLNHPLEGKVLYGYVDKHSPELMKAMNRVDSRVSASMILKIRFPKDSIANNQVEIVEYIENGWVRLEASKDSITPDRPLPLK